MKWQVRYALENLREGYRVTSAEHVGGEAIRLTVREQPDVLAVVADTYRMNAERARQYHQEWPDMDFLCGYRKDCVWEGDAIDYLEANLIGWGSAGTLGSAVLKGSAKTEAHKDYAFSYRVIQQLGCVKGIHREFDRIFSVQISSGRLLRVGMILDYEPLADHVRTLWTDFGPVDVVWSINPNGSITPSAYEAAGELKCQVLKWEDLKALLQKG